MFLITPILQDIFYGRFFLDRGKIGCPHLAFEAAGRRLLAPRYQAKLVKVDEALNVMEKQMIIGLA